jgi:hypothetical protein
MGEATPGRRRRRARAGRIEAKSEATRRRDASLRAIAWMMVVVVDT